jgi:hypothetical protein
VAVAGDDSKYSDLPVATPTSQPSGGVDKGGTFSGPPSPEKEKVRSAWPGEGLGIVRNKTGRHFQGSGVWLSSIGSVNF